jgi:hypothetical protein
MHPDSFEISTMAVPPTTSNPFSLYGSVPVTIHIPFSSEALKGFSPSQCSGIVLGRSTTTSITKAQESPQHIHVGVEGETQSNGNAFRFPSLGS